MADPAGSVSVEAGSNIVTGYLTQFTAAELDTLVIRGVSGIVARTVSTSRIELRRPWRGPTLTGEMEWDLLPTGPAWSSTVVLNRRVADLLQKFEVGPIKPDAYGTIGQRSQYNDQGIGFVYLSVDDPFRMYIKLFNTNSASDWSEGQIVGPTKLDYKITPEDIQRAMTTLVLSWPDLPASDDQIPDAGGWYRNGSGFVYIERKA